MTRELLALLAGLVTAAAGIASAVAADEGVSPAADRLLWCASAFYWLARSADDAGDPVEAELYDNWSQKLLESGAAALVGAGVEPARIEELTASYDNAVLEELGTDKARYDIVSCPELVEAGPRGAPAPP